MTEVADQVAASLAGPLTLCLLALSACSSGELDPSGQCGPGTIESDNGDCVELSGCLVDNGGCDPLTACTDNAGSMECGACPVGYSGDGDSGCVDINDCLSDNGGCDPLTACTDAGVDAVVCGPCPAGYSGTGDSGCVPLSVVSISNFEVTTSKDPQPVSCGDVQITFVWESANADTCHGSWQGSIDNPEGLLSDVDGTQSLLFVDLAGNEDFTLRCTNDFDEAGQVKSVGTVAPCLTTSIVAWADKFPRDWPGQPSSRIAEYIPAPTSLAIEFNTANIATVGSIGTVEYSSTRGNRLVAISTKPGDYQVADECRDSHFIDGNMTWETEGSNEFPDACRLQANTTYYWNTTFSDGVNADSGTCTGTPCFTYLNAVTLYRE